MTDGENVGITAKMYYLFNDHFKCDDKRKNLIKRVGEEKADIMMKAQNGCGSISEKYRYDIDGIKYHQCVCGYKSNKLSVYLDLLDKLDKGVMPYGGSYMEQPAKLVEILNRVSFLKSDLMQQIADKNQG